LFFFVDDYRLDGVLFFMVIKDIKGRGAGGNPTNRFERLAVEAYDEDLLPEDVSDRVETVYLDAASKSILTKNDSPDVGFRYSVNPYYGCTHGCAYCYARPYHEYWGMSAGLDFESKILVKRNAPQLLREALDKKSYEPDVIAMSGVTDCYQPGEKEFRLTRQCLQVLAEYKNPVGMITKNRLVTRDIDVLQEMTAWGGACVIVSVTTLDAELSGKLEPGASRPQARLDAISALAAAGIPVGVNAAPMIPGLTDQELPAIIQAAADAGAQFASYIVVRLPGAVGGIFEEWLERNYPNSRQKVMNRIAEVHGGKVADARFGVRMKGEGAYAMQLKALFAAAKRRAGLGEHPKLTVEHFRRPERGQMDLFF
jgi:DNA repair photolyase